MQKIFLDKRETEHQEAKQSIFKLSKRSRKHLIVEGWQQQITRLVIWLP
jgi:hypothetical protein